MWESLQQDWYVAKGTDDFTETEAEAAFDKKERKSYPILLLRLRTWNRIRLLRFGLQYPTTRMSTYMI